MHSPPPRQLVTDAHPAQGPAPANCLRIHMRQPRRGCGGVGARSFHSEAGLGSASRLLALVLFLPHPPSLLQTHNIPFPSHVRLLSVSLCVFCPRSELPQERGVRWLRHLTSLMSTQVSQSRHCEIVACLHLTRRCQVVCSPAGPPPLLSPHLPHRRGARSVADHASPKASGHHTP